MTIEQVTSGSNLLYRIQELERVKEWLQQKEGERPVSLVDVLHAKEMAARSGIIIEVNEEELIKATKKIIDSKIEELTKELEAI
jgi:hypothetical protein